MLQRVAAHSAFAGDVGGFSFLGLLWMINGGGFFFFQFSEPPPLNPPESVENFVKEKPYPDSGWRSFTSMQ